jgi:hypothetical protein
METLWHSYSSNRANSATGANARACGVVGFPRPTFAIKMTLSLIQIGSASGSAVQVREALGQDSA